MYKYTVYQVADMLNTSHTTIYKKINNKEVYKHLQGFITKHGRSTYLSSEGIEILKNHIQPKETFINSLETKVTEEEPQTSKSIDNIALETFINSLETNNKQLIESMGKQIEELKQDKLKLYEQLETKDKQLTSKEDNTANLTRLLENSQVLLKQHQEKVFLLESQAVEKQEPIVEQLNKIESLESEMKYIKDLHQTAIEKQNTMDEHSKKFESQQSEIESMNEVLKQMQDKLFMLESPPIKKVNSFWDRLNIFKRQN